jgi:hypothetical protein
MRALGSSLAGAGLFRKATSMIKIIIMMLVLCALVGALASCCSGDKTPPPPPHGTPDDTSTYNGPDGYVSVTYTYYCLSGQYVSLTYVRVDECSEYVLESDYKSDGICY